MLRVSIFSKDLNFINSIYKNISENNWNIRIIGIYRNVDLRFRNSSQLISSHIIICDDNYYLKLKRIFKDSFIYLKYPSNSQETILNQLLKLSLNSKYSYKLDLYNFKKQFYNKLVELKFNPNLCGTLYILDCILCIRENPYSHATHLNLTQHFQKIAKKYNTTTNSIIWNIKASIEEMYKYTDKSFRRKIYGTDYFISYQHLIRSLCLL